MSADKRAMLAAALLNTVIDTLCGEGAEPPYAFDSVAAREALALATAILAESDPMIATPKLMREATEKMARDVRAYARSCREQRDRGNPVWDVTTVLVQ